jgi:lipid-A-disaccharide synthase
MSAKQIMIIAGEASGDLHASNLVLEIAKKDADVRFVGIGGTRMQAAGVALIFDNHTIAVTGFSEILSKVGQILKAHRAVKKTLRRERPDLLILVDFPDFNLRVGAVAKKLGIPVLYYISPQVWAWRKQRVHQIRELVEKIMVILPFEASLYGDKGIFVGHPLLDAIRPTLSQSEAREHFGLAPEDRVVTLLPGSRSNEIRSLLPDMLEAVALIRDRVPAVRFLLPIAPTVSEAEVAAISGRSPVPIETFPGRVYEALSVSDFAIVASGTATLETAHFGVPMVILYRVSALTYFLAKRLVRIPHIGLINMVAGERVVPELIQDAVTPRRIAEEALQCLEDRNHAGQISRKLKAAMATLGEPGASARAASVVLNLIGEAA